jgi:hypothetical protein
MCQTKSNPAIISPPRGVELLPGEARLAATVGALIVLASMLDTGTLRGLRDFRSSLSHRSHEANQRIATACCIGSLVAPSNVKLLITMRHHEHVS